VEFLRRSLEPVTVTGHMVDSVAFTETLRKWRPDL
jgi:predicted transcriptional regulator